MRPLPPPLRSSAFLDVEPSQRRGRALLVHGYTGGPFEVSVVARALHEAGFTCTLPVLPGHCADPAALGDMTWQTWLEGARAALDAIPDDGPLVVVGCSMGGLLALQLSLARPVAALVLLAPALRYFAKDAAAIAAIEAVRGWRLRAFIDKEAPGGDVFAADAQRANPTYKVLPVRGMVELLRLQRATTSLLPRVTAPLCLLHGAADHTIPVTASTEIARSVGSSRIEQHTLRHTAHLVGLDVERDLVCELMMRFVDAQVPPRASRSSSPEAA